MNFTEKFLLVTFFMILADICWTMYFISVEKRHAIYAGMWSGMIMLMGSLVTINYVGDHRLLGAAIVGSFIGSGGTVYFKRHKKKEIEKSMMDLKEG